MSKVVVGGLLVLCIAANTYLLLNRDRKASTTPPAPAELEKRLTTAEARLARLHPLEERFEMGERSYESEARVKPLLDKIFKVAGESQKPAYVVECRGRICKLSVDNSINRYWMGPLQADPDGKGMFATMTLGRSDAFMELHDVQHAAGLQAAIKLATAVRDSKAVADCNQQHRTPGGLQFRISIDARTHKFVAEAVGSLADQALGVCVRRVVEHVIASTALPPDAILSEPIPYIVRWPPGAM